MASLIEDHGNDRTVADQHAPTTVVKESPHEMDFNVELRNDPEHITGLMRSSFNSLGLGDQGGHGRHQHALTTACKSAVRELHNHVCLFNVTATAFGVAS